MTAWTLYTVNDGKWQIVLHLREDEGFKYRYEPRPDIRNLVDEHYNAAPEELAKILLYSVLHCDAVQINMMCGPSLYVEK